MMCCGLFRAHVRRKSGRACTFSRSLCVAFAALYSPSRMGSRKVAALKRLENAPTNGPASFCKMRSNLFKKARKLSTHSHAEVALIGFSSSGSLFHFHAGSRSMQEIVQDYLHTHKGNPLEPLVCAPFPNSQDERERLKDKVQIFEEKERRKSDDMEEMKLPSVKELETLESEIECELNHLRKMKELLIAEIRKESARKEQELLRENERLRNKLVSLEGRVLKKERCRVAVSNISTCSSYNDDDSADSPQSFAAQESLHPL